MTIENKKITVGDVLIADDDTAICEILEDYCKKMDCFRNIIVVNDGSMASTKMRNQKFCLILVDLKMPKKGGIDIIRELDGKSVNRKNRIIVVSGTLDKTMTEKIMVLGVSNFLPKPFDEASFKEKVLKVLASK